MGKFLLGVAVGVVVAFLGLLIIGLVIGRIFARKQPEIASNSALVLSLQEDIPEASPLDVGIPFFQQRSVPTVRDLWTSLHMAAKDNRIKAIVLKPEGLAIGSAKLQEIHQELMDFRHSGKPIYAFLQSPGSREYYLATTADKVFLSPTDLLNVKGFRAEITYFKSALEKIGVNFQVDHIGAYKDAGDIFTRTNMSPETRDVLNAVLDQLYGDFCTTVAQGRHKTPDEVKALVDQGPFTASQAKASGLVDEIGYEDQLYGDLNKKTGLELNKLNIKTYSRGVAVGGDRIAVIVGEGEITHGTDNSFQTGTISYGEMRKTIRQVRDDGSIKGVILRVDSPGGDAVASDEILHEMKLLAAVKPVVISFSDLAASGGYYISMTGDPIVSYPNTITGSIGVVYARPNIQGLLSKIGVNADSVSRGKLAALDSLSEPLSDAGMQKLHESLLETYNSFVSKVAAARRKTFDQIQPLAQGHVWMGAQARQNGLVDELGGFNRSIALIRQKAHLPPNGDTNLVMYPPKRSIWEMLANVSDDSLADAASETKLRKLVPGIPSRLLLRGGVLRMLPYRLTVQ
ncbi:MAG TPA: signal peptide peptidase SppA [Bryobacteraceae bacterium]|jgi:protease-4|nr:signal peptide peptidase SppA [Bryobacteraceae bacterium]